MRPFAELEPGLLETLELADEGARVVAWTRANMPVLAALREKLAAELPLTGRRIGMCLHVEAKTAVLVEVLRAGGAEVVITGGQAPRRRRPLGRREGSCPWLRGSASGG